VIVTTNLPFEEWKEVLGDERLTGAALDRLTHRCTIIATGKESYRLREARRRRGRVERLASPWLPCLAMARVRRQKVARLMPVMRAI
jgi:hypothetical protein